MIGHQSLRKAGILHRDISMNNVLVNEKDNSGFLIDLDRAIREKRLKTSGARDKTGTKVFMAVGALSGQQHSFMHDLESFFWVLFWICIHYSEPKEAPRVMPEFGRWNYLTTDELATMKAGTISNERRFLEMMLNCVTPYFQPLIPCINELRDIVFPNNSEWTIEDDKLYERMIDVLGKAREDKEVIGG
jgi:serine/threonine protein kinase